MAPDISNSKKYSEFSTPGKVTYWLMRGRVLS